MKVNVRPREVAVGWVVVGLGAAIYTVLLPLRERAQKTNCQTNLKQIGLAMMQYVRDYDETFVLAPKWKAELLPYSHFYRAPDFQQGYACPKTRRDYAFNAGLDGAVWTMVKHPETVAMFYEPLRPINADGGQSWAPEGIHDDGSNVCFHDGHVKWIQAKPVFWAPEMADVAGTKRKRDEENQRIIAQIKAQAAKQQRLRKAARSRSNGR